MQFSVRLPSARATSILKWFLPLLMMGAVWFAVIRILWCDWMHDPQYSYGSLVPLLALGLLLKRWEDRPNTETSSRLAIGLAAFICVISAASLALIIPLAEANPEWRPLGGAASFAAIALTLTLIYMIGGRGWLRHFAFPILFSLIATPWPRNLEQSVMGCLMEWNTTATLEVLHWFGREAISRGNLILLPCGLLGIEEACSGIRSLQSGLMVALFFGELFRLGFFRRVWLVILAVLAALLGNLVRSSFLAVMASSRGLSCLAAWHDSAGFAALIMTMLPLVIAAFLLRDKKDQGNLSNPPCEHRRVIVSRPCMMLMACSILLMASTMGCTELWFLLHESDRESPAWSLKRRLSDPGVSSVAIPAATLRMLFNPEGFSERWVTYSGHQAQVFYFRWPAGRISSQAVAMHHPEVCLGNIGMRMRQVLSPANVTVNGFVIPFRAWLFDQNGKRVYVFHAVVEDGAGEGVPEAIPDTLAVRLQRVRAGRRNRGERLVEVAFWNEPDERSARYELSRYLGDAVTAGNRHAPFQGVTTPQPQH